MVQTHPKLVEFVPFYGTYKQVIENPFGLFDNGRRLSSASEALRDFR